MLQPHRYKNNLLVAYRTAMTLFLAAFLPVGLFTALTVFVCLHRYQKQSANAYVFHTGGASIQIYEPTGPQQQAGQTVLREAKKRHTINARQATLTRP